MSTSTENPIVMDLMDSYGSLLLGVLFSAMVWGVSCMQVFLYFFNYESDTLAIKSLVLFVWAVDTVHEVLLIQSMFPLLILHWGDVSYLSKIQPGLIHHSWIAGIVAVVVQAYFLYRIYIFNGKKWFFPVALSLVSLWQIFGNIHCVVDSIKTMSVSTIYMSSMIHMALSVRAVSAGVDILIAGAMVFLLIKQGHTVYSTSKRLVFRLIIMIINSGVWTAVVAIIDLGLIASHPKGFQYCIFEFPLSALYVNTLLANLNARNYLMDRDNRVSGTGFSGQSRSENKGVISLGPMKPNHKSQDRTDTIDNPSGEDPESIAIRIDTTKVVFADAEDYHQTLEGQKQDFEAV